MGFGSAPRRSNTSLLRMGNNRRNICHSFLSRPGVCIAERWVTISLVIAMGAVVP